MAGRKQACKVVVKQKQNPMLCFVVRKQKQTLQIEIELVNWKVNAKKKLKLTANVALNLTEIFTLS